MKYALNSGFQLEPLRQEGDIWLTTGSEQSAANTQWEEARDAATDLSLYAMFEAQHHDLLGGYVSTFFLG